MTVQEEVEFINFEEFFYNFTNFFKIRKPFSLEYSIKGFDNYADGSSATIVSIPTTAVPTFQMQSNAKGVITYLDSVTKIYININSQIPNPSGNPGTTSGNTAPNVNLTNLQAFLVDDDDLNTMLSIRNTSQLSYQVIVRYKDGSSSKLSAPFFVQ